MLQHLRQSWVSEPHLRQEHLSHPHPTSPLHVVRLMCTELSSHCHRDLSMLRIAPVLCSISGAWLACCFAVSLDPAQIGPVFD